MANRWWVYQRERFPVFAHGVLIAAFSFSAVSFSRLVRGAEGAPVMAAIVVAFGTAFLFFLQLRIADEFKDFDEDARFRPYRPVPRGLVTLRELGLLGAGAAAAQFALCLWLDPSLVILLAVAWTYLAAMSKEFFVGEWLKTRHVLYMFSHMMIIPLVDLYATACDWWPAGEGVPRGLGWFLAVSYTNGIVIETGRKIRTPVDEEHGVNTYSALWGPKRAAFVWLTAMTCTAIFAVGAATHIHFVVPVAVTLGGLLLLALATVVGFLKQPRAGGGKRIENLSGVWTICMYLILGAIPLAWRWWLREGTP